MAQRPGGEPTEAPTQKRLDKARREGQVAYSPRVGAFLQVVVLLVLGSWGLTRAGGVLSRSAKALISGSVPADAALRYALNQLISAFIPFAAALFFALLTAGFLQVGFRFNLRPLMPKLARVNPAQGFKRIFSAQRLWELVTGVGAVAMAAVIFFFHLKGNMRPMFGAVGRDLAPAMTILIAVWVGLIMKLTLLFGAIAAIDWYLAFRKHSRELMMTRYEVKKEMESEEGNPHTKGERRRVHLELSQMGLQRAVANADAVVVNPTHIACALAHDPDTGGIIMVASGTDEAASEIRGYARSSRVPLFHDKRMARQLLSVPPGGVIPENLAASLEVVLLSLKRYGG